jgi:hypothetical protein
MHPGTMKSVNSQSFDRKPVMGRALRAGLRRNEWPRRNRALGRAICRLETVFEHADHDHYAAGSSGDNVGSPALGKGTTTPPGRID